MRSKCLALTAVMFLSPTIAFAQMEIPALRESLPVPASTEPASQSLDRSKGQKWNRAEFRLSGSMCPACLLALEERLRTVPSIAHVKVDYKNLTADKHEKGKRNASLIVIYDAESVRLEGLIKVIKAEKYKLSEVRQADY